MKTVADLIEDQEIRDLEAQASALLANLDTILAKIRALKASKEARA